MPMRARIAISLLLFGALAAGPGQAVAQGAQDGVQLLAAGVKALEAGEHRQAVRQLSQAMRSNTLKPGQIAKALYRRGVAQRSMGRPAQAIADLNSALWLQGLTKAEQADAHLNRSLAYKDVGMDDRAKGDLQRARELGTGNAAIAAATRSGQPAPAVPSFQTEVRTAERSPAPAAPFRTEVRTAARQPAAAPASPFQTRVETAPTTTRPARSATPSPAPPTAFRTEVRAAERKPDPVPGFRTSILPDETKPPPRPAAPTPRWSTAVAPDTEETTETPEEERKSTVGSFLSGLWKSAGGGDEKKTPQDQAQAPQKPAPAASSQWTQTTRVATRAAPPAAAPRPAPAAVPRPAPASPQAGGRNYRVQLAAVRSEDEAQTTWQRLAAKHGTLLAGRSPVIEKTELGAMGTFYRIQIGPFANKRESAELCNHFKRNGVDCFLVAR